MKLLSHGPEPCASANSATSAYHVCCPFKIKQHDYHNKIRGFCQDCLCDIISRMSRRRKGAHRKKRTSGKAGIRFTRKTVILLIAGTAILIFAIWAIHLAAEASSLPDPKGSDLGYPVHGIDVSSYQGSIDWPKLADQGISFVFIKATEGSSHKDKKFSSNWKGAHKTDLKVGAYHFMSFETSGESQARNFISTVPKTRGMLPPVIDLEFYGSYTKNTLTEASVRAILDPLVKALKQRYGMDPVIYTSRSIYGLYVSGKYDNDIWISDPSMIAKLPDGEDWTFCQYSFSGILEGYSGAVKHIDLDVYNGSKLDFAFHY